MKKMNIIATVASTVLLASCLVATGSALVMDEVDPSRNNVADATTGENNKFAGCYYVSMSDNWLESSASFKIKFEYNDNGTKLLNLKKGVNNPDTANNEENYYYFNISDAGTNIRNVSLERYDSSGNNFWNKTGTFSVDDFNGGNTVVCLTEGWWNTHTFSNAGLFRGAIVSCKKDTNYNSNKVRVWLDRNGNKEDGYQYLLSYYNVNLNERFFVYPTYYEISQAPKSNSASKFLAYYDLPIELYTDFDKGYEISIDLYDTTKNMCWQAKNQKVQLHANIDSDDKDIYNKILQIDSIDNDYLSVCKKCIKEIWGNTLLVADGTNNDYSALAKVLEYYDSCSSSKYNGWGALHNLEKVWNINTSDAYLAKVAGVNITDKEYNGQTVFTCKDKIEQLYKTEPKQVPNKQLKGIVSDDPIQNLTLAGLALTSVTALVIAVSLKKRKVLSK